MLKNRLLVTSALAMLAMAEASAPARPVTEGQTPKPRRRTVATPARWPSEPDQRTQQQREIAEWNSAVDRRKAEKKLGRNA